MKLEEVIYIRISKELKDALELESRRLNVRPIDVIRWSIAHAIQKQRPSLIFDDSKVEDVTSSKL